MPGPEIEAETVEVQPAQTNHSPGAAPSFSRGTPPAMHTASDAPCEEDPAVGPGVPPPSPHRSPCELPIDSGWHLLHPQGGLGSGEEDQDRLEILKANAVDYSMQPGADEEEQWSWRPALCALTDAESDFDRGEEMEEGPLQHTAADVDMTETTEPRLDRIRGGDEDLLGALSTAFMAMSPLVHPLCQIASNVLVVVCAGSHHNR